MYQDEDYTSMARHIERLSKDLAEINAELFIRRQQGTGSLKGPRSAGKLVAVACHCRPPRRFKLTGKAYDGGPIICGNCKQPFKLALRESRSEDAGIQRTASIVKASSRLPEDDHCSGLG